MSPSGPRPSLSEFISLHRSTLERDEARHNLILAMLAAATDGQSSDVMTWSLGVPGQCAVMSSTRFMVLADIDGQQCRALAELTTQLDYVGVVGPDQTAPSFARRAAELGTKFLAPMPQRILRLAEKPKYPGCPGHPRLATADDVDLMADWTTGFIREAAPHDSMPSRERLESMAHQGRHVFWIVDDQPVSMAAIARRTQHAAAISSVYTPPLLRGQGYGGSVTAAVVEHVFAASKTAACLYVDLRNPYSNRCYAKIGFAPVCDSWLYPRDNVAAVPPSPR